jgi:hypothetical protein
MGKFGYSRLGLKPVYGNGQIKVSAIYRNGLKTLIPVYGNGEIEVLAIYRNG